MRQRRSMPIPVLGEILHCLLERNAATRAAIDSVHQLVDRGTRSKLTQFRQQVLLERFARACSSASEHGVCLVGEVTYKYMWHSFIMIAPLPRTLVEPLERICLHDARRRVSGSRLGPNIRAALPSRTMMNQLPSAQGVAYLRETAAG